jgi:cysteine desulfurase
LAAEIALRDLSERMAHTAALQKELWGKLKAAIQYITLNGPPPGPRRLTTNLNVSAEFVEGEGLMLLCDVNGIAVASGTSCVSKALKISPVLSAIRLDESLAQGSIIMSLGKDNTEGEIAYVVETFVKIVNKLRAMTPRWDEFQRGSIDSIICPTGRAKSLAKA